MCVLDQRTADEILASLAGGRVTYRYFKDRYALQLLAYAAAEAWSVRALRQSRFAPLLMKPSVRQALADRNGRGVDWLLLDSYFPSPTEDYELTFGIWGSIRNWHWNQTTRSGFNIVLQLNFPAGHDRVYRRLIDPRKEDPFSCGWHPINRAGLRTLAWSRIDVEPESGEALIEEIQSDWVRNAEDAAIDALSNLVDGFVAAPDWVENVGCDAAQLFWYVEHALAPHRRMWREAMLSASLWLIREHLGIRRIFIHTHESGCALKMIKGRSRPPRSLYEEAPRAFCFERTDEPPEFLERHLVRRSSRAQFEFWRLRL